MGGAREFRAVKVTNEETCTDTGFDTSLDLPESDCCLFSLGTRDLLELCFVFTVFNLLSDTSCVVWFSKFWGISAFRSGRECALDVERRLVETFKLRGTFTFFVSFTWWLFITVLFVSIACKGSLVATSLLATILGASGCSFESKTFDLSIDWKFNLRDVTFAAGVFRVTEVVAFKL